MCLSRRRGHREGPLRAVEEDDRQGTVRIPEGGYLQPVGEVGGGDALGAGPDVPAEMADIVVGELDLHFPPVPAFQMRGPRSSPPRDWAPPPR